MRLAIWSRYLYCNTVSLYVGTVLGPSPYLLMLFLPRSFKLLGRPGGARVNEEEEESKEEEVEEEVEGGPLPCPALPGPSRAGMRNA